MKSFDFSTFHTTIPHQKLKERLTSIIRYAFILKNGNRRYKYLVLWYEETYFVKEHSDSKNKYSEDDIIKMLEFLVDNILKIRGFCQKSLPADSRHSNLYKLCPASRRHISVFIRSWFIQSLLSTGKKHLASRFNLTYRYIDDISSINNPEFEIIWPDVSCWNWDQGHHREHHFCFLPRFTLYYCRFGGMVNFTLRSTTNEMISISTSLTFRSWVHVVIFHLRQPMVFLSLKFYDTHWLARRMNVLFWGPGDFPVSY